MKLWRTDTKVEGCREPFVDFFRADTAAEARALWEAEAKASGLPMQRTTVTITDETPNDAAIFAKGRG